MRALLACLLDSIRFGFGLRRGGFGVSGEASDLCVVLVGTGRVDSGEWMGGTRQRAAGSGRESDVRREVFGFSCCACRVL